MFVVDIDAAQVRSYDSLGNDQHEAFETLIKVLKQRWTMDRRQESFPTYTYQKMPVPRQRDGTECGVYVCVFLEFLTRRSRVTLNENSFTEADMAGFRKQLVKQMLVQQRPTDFIASFTA